MQGREFLFRDVHHNLDGFITLVKFYADAHKGGTSVKADMKETKWFDADMCAPLGALIKKLNQEKININLVNLQDKVKEVFQKNSFLLYHGNGRIIPDTWDTTITYKEFSVDDGQCFARYVGSKLVKHRSLPDMSEKLIDFFYRSVCDIFDNAARHSNTKLGVVSCGQYFPHKLLISFTIADLGVGIRKNVRDHTGNNLTAIEAINWAVILGNTTKSDGDPGGMGLNLLCEFINTVGGCVRIISENAYWEKRNSNIVERELPCLFPGTVVNFEVRQTNDESDECQSNFKIDNF